MYDQCWVRHQYLGVTTQAYEKHLNYNEAFISAVVYSLEKTKTKDDGQCGGYGESTPQVG